MEFRRQISGEVLMEGEIEETMGIVRDKIRLVQRRMEKRGSEKLRRIGGMRNAWRRKG